MSRTSKPFGLPPAVVIVSTASGVALGLAYSLSAMLVCFGLAVPFLFAWAGRGVPPRERRWVLGLLGAAMAARLLTLAVLFMLTDHERQAFATLFGDEMHITLTSLWLRNIALKIPIEPFYVFAVYDSYGSSGFIWMVAFLQLFIGPSPYGIHLLNVALHLTGCVALSRVVRSAYGRGSAMCVLITLLFWPTLLIWSVSALKETSVFFLNAMLVTAVLAATKANTWRGRVLLVGIAIVLLWAIGTLRSAVLAITLAGVIGAVAGYVATRLPRLAAACAVLCLFTVGVGLTSARVQEPIVARAREAARYHLGSVYTPGSSYRLLDERFYRVGGDEVLASMSVEEATRFAIRAVVSFWVTPAPWQTASAAQLAYVPQQILWYLAAVLAVAGSVVGLRKNLPLTAMLLGYTLAGMGLIGLYNGNVGTLVRIRDIVVPMVLCLSGVGASALLQKWADRFMPARGAGQPVAAAPSLAFMTK